LTPFIDEQGQRFSREDYNQQSTHNGVGPNHEHSYNYNEKGQPIGKDVRSIDQNGKPIGPRIKE
jgi:hypothetical protein